MEMEIIRSNTKKAEEERRKRKEQESAEAFQRTKNWFLKNVTKENRLELILDTHQVM